MTLRILAERKSGQWIATCLELNLVVEGETVKQIKARMSDAIDSYLKAVFDTNDPLSIPSLVNRPAPLSVRIKFWIVKKIRDFENLKIMLIQPHVSCTAKAA